MEFKKLMETRRADLLSSLLKRVERMKGLDDKVDDVLKKIEVTTTRLDRAGAKRSASFQDGQTPAKRLPTNDGPNRERVCAEEGV